jgi:predicted DCC family thiol-disulfide oxidoreductase YuxK
LLLAAYSPAPLAHALLLLCGLFALVDHGSLPAAGTQDTEALVFYDGVCGLCQRSVQLVVREDRHARIKLAPLQGETARKRLPAASLAGSKGDPDEPDSMLALEGERLYSESDSWLFIARHLGGAWRLLQPLTLLPKGVREAAYRFIARNRYAWFGKLDACPVPDAAVRARFLP